MLSRRRGVPAHGSPAPPAAQIRVARVRVATPTAYPSRHGLNVGRGAGAGVAGGEDRRGQGSGQGRGQGSGEDSGEGRGGVGGLWGWDRRGGAAKLVWSHAWTGLRPSDGGGDPRAAAGRCAGDKGAGWGAGAGAGAGAAWLEGLRGKRDMAAAAVAAVGAMLR